MKVFFIRLWRMFRWWTVVIFLLFVWVCWSVGEALFRLGIHQALESSVLLIGPVIILTITVLIAAVVAPRLYRQSEYTRSYSDVLMPLVASAEEYCLLLRPFGSDGEVVLPYGYRPWWLPSSLGWTVTLEQVVASAARKSLGLKVYALVDQGRLLAPPGPVYLRSPHDQWQTVTQILIRRAHSIVIILAPGQEIRTSFQWEIDQIAQHNLKERVTIVLPPCNPYSQSVDYRRAVQQACVLLAAFEGFAGSTGDVDPLRVYHWEQTLADRTQIIKFGKGYHDDVPQVTWWYQARRKRSQAKIGAKFYRTQLVPAFKMTERELSELNFPSRYPWRFLP